MMTRNAARATLAWSLTLLLAACGGDAGNGAPSGNASAAPAEEQLSELELEQGIGPVRDLELGAVDPTLAAEGETAFVTKCSGCHKVEERYVGPRLGTVLERRRPEFVMNMILNANEMVQKHPVVRQMLAEYYTPMPVQVTDPDEARAILEYLRSVRIDSTSAVPSPTPGGAGGN